MISTGLAPVLGTLAFTWGLWTKQTCFKLLGPSRRKHTHTHTQPSVAQGLSLVCKELQRADSGIPAQHIPSRTTESLSPFAAVVRRELSNHLLI